MNKKLSNTMIAIFTILGLIICFIGMKTELEKERIFKEVLKENEQLKGQIEMQKSVIMDLEENLRDER